MARCGFRPALRDLRRALSIWTGISAAWLAGVQVSFGQGTVPGPITFTAGVPNSNFGRSIAAGDFNDDGFPDILVGAPGTLGDSVTGINPSAAIGRAYIYYGSDFTSSMQLTNPLPLTPTTFGWAVTAAEGCASPVSSPGLADAIVSAPLTGGPPHQGTVYRYSGDSPDPVTTLANPAIPTDPTVFRFGVSLAARRAVPGVSLSWLAIGSTGVSLPLVDHSGRVYAGSCTLEAPWAGSWVGGGVFCIEPNFGASVAYNETVVGTASVIIIGTPYATRSYGAPSCLLLGGEQGRVHVWDAGGGGNPQWYQVDGESSFGTWVASGNKLYDPTALFPDTAVGAPFSSGKSGGFGKVYLFDGNLVNPFGGPGIHPYIDPPTKSPAYGDPSQVLEGSGHLGRSVAIAGLSADPDALQGVVAGAPLTDGQGKVHAFDGSPDFVPVAELALFTPGGGFCAENPMFGWSVAVADFNQDGYPDIAAGRPCAGTGPQEQQGGVTVHFGCAKNAECATGVCGQGYCRLPGS